MHQSRNALKVVLLLGAAGIALTTVIVAVAALRSQSAAHDGGRGAPQTIGQPNEAASPTREPTATPPTELPTASPGPASVLAPPNGTNMVEPQGPTGLGTLTVINGTELDAVAKLIDDDEPKTTLRFVYIRAGSQTTLSDIGTCTCVLRFSLGRDWDQSSRRFLRDQSYSQFDDKLKFKETETNDGTRYATFEVTLNPVPEGNASTKSIDERAFDAP